MSRSRLISWCPNKTQKTDPKKTFIPPRGRKITDISVSVLLSGLSLGILFRGHFTFDLISNNLFIQIFMLAQGDLQIDRSLV